MGNEAVSRFEIKFDREWNDMCLLYGKKHKERFPRKNESYGVSSEFEEKLLIEMYRLGCSYNQMGDSLNMTAEAIGNKLAYMFKSGKMEKLGVEKR